MGVRSGIAVFAASLMVLAVSFSASSQESPEKKETQTQTEAPAKTVIVPDAATLRSIFDDAVKIFRDEKAAGEASEERKESREKADVAAQQSMAMWAGWMAFFAFAQLLLTAGTIWWLYRTFQQTERTADAAIDAARAAVAAERARIFVEIDSNNAYEITKSVGLFTHETSWDTRMPTIFVSYLLRNHGKTPAIIQEIGHHLIVEPDLPRGRTYSALAPIPISQVIAGGDASDPIGPCQLLRGLKVKDGRALHGMGDNPTTLWFYGYVNYDDTFGQNHTLEHVWHYNGDTLGLRLYSFEEKTRPKKKPAA